MRALRAEFVLKCEAVKVRPGRVEARTAFVTFDSEEAYLRCRRAYEQPSLPLAARVRQALWGGPPPELRWKGTVALDVRPVSKPSDYVWECVGLSPWTRAGRVALSNALACALLLVGFIVIVAANGAKARAARQLGAADCTVHRFAPFNGDPSWAGALREREDARAALLLQPQAGGAVAGAAEAMVTRVDVQHNVWPLSFNNTSPDPGLLGCYCLAVLASPSASLASQVSQLPHMCQQPND